MSSLKKIGLFMQQAIWAFRADEASRFGASLAYYSVFSLAPLLVIAVSIASIIFGSSAAEEKIFVALPSMLGTDGSEAVKGFMNATDGTKRGSALSLAGFFLLLFGAASVFRELQDALNHIFEVASKRQGIVGFIVKNFLAFGMVLASGFLLLVSLILSVVLSLFFSYFSGNEAGRLWILEISNFVLSFGFGWGIFALIFRYVPSCRLKWRDIAWGAGVTAVLFTLGKTAIGLYLGRTGVASLYGAAESVTLILLWVYYSSQILFFGAEVVAVRVGLKEKKELHEDIRKSKESI